ncbi:MAG TPA: hypothetical protein VN937_08350 [Blastocatellia bacterium]|nr:hypothetical protein [Blastocatellia bacterium]
MNTDEHGSKEYLCPSVFICGSHLPGSLAFIRVTQSRSLDSGSRISAFEGHFLSPYLRYLNGYWHFFKVLYLDKAYRLI